MRVLLA